MDFNRIMSMHMVSDSRENIQTRIGCITLKGVLHHYVYDNGYTSDIVEMTAPYSGKKRALYDHRVTTVIDDKSCTLEAIALKKIYKQEMMIRRRERYLKRSKAKIAELLPIWFEYDARMGYADATERTECRRITRQARRDEALTARINAKLSLVRKRLDNERNSLTRNFSGEVNRALRKTRLQDLQLDYGDACRLFGDDVWEQLLERFAYRIENVAEIESVALRLFNDFSFLYNMEQPKLEEGDVVETIGFGGAIMAVALRRNDNVVGVGAIDNVRGRKALRVLVGGEQLAKILPKRLYSAVTRHEPFCVRGSVYYRSTNDDRMITIY